MKCIISTDTSCLVNNEMLKAYDISIFPLNVIIDGEEFLDGVSINQEQLKTAMRSGKRIQTSTPPLGTVIDYFKKLFEKGYDHVIHFTISSKLSSMNALFEMVALQNFPGKITVIDAYSVSAPMLSYVLFAYEQIQLGTAPEKIKEEIDKYKTQYKIYFIPENLTALKNGGRISPTIALVGNLIGIKPVLELKDGEIQKICMTKNARKYLCETIDSVKNDYPIDSYDYTFVYFDASERAYTSVCEHLQTSFPNAKFLTGFLPINVAAHAGPGTIGIAITPKINGKSLTEY